MNRHAIFVGGCPHSFHRIEPAIGPLCSCLGAIGFETSVSGIFHPKGEEEYLGDYSALTAERLSEVDLVLLYTTGTEIRGADINALLTFVRKGGALAGIHCATDSFTDNPEYVHLIGGKFRTHPSQLDITTEIVDVSHPVTAGLSNFTLHDELYLFSDYDPSNVHLFAQTHSFDDNGPVPIAWTREEGKGRVFYVSLGHNSSTLENPDWQRLFMQGVQWAAELR